MCGARLRSGGLWLWVSAMVGFFFLTGAQTSAHPSLATALFPSPRALVPPRLQSFFPCRSHRRTAAFYFYTAARAAVLLRSCQT